MNVKSFHAWLGNANPRVIFQTRVYGFDGIQTRLPGFDMVGHLSVADSQIVYYKQLRGGQMEVWLYIDTQTIRDEAYYRNIS